MRLQMVLEVQYESRFCGGTHPMIASAKTESDLAIEVKCKFPKKAEA
jgi:hypothetical protein